MSLADYHNRDRQQRIQQHKLIRRENEIRRHLNFRMACFGDRGDQQRYNQFLDSQWENR